MTRSGEEASVTAMICSSLALLFLVCRLSNRIFMVKCVGLDDYLAVCAFFGSVAWAVATEIREFSRFLRAQWKPWLTRRIERQYGMGQHIYNLTVDQVKGMMKVSEQWRRGLFCRKARRTDMVVCSF